MSDLRTTHDTATQTIVDTANLADGNWTSEWDDAAQNGESHFHNDGRSVWMQTTFTGEHLYWTRDEPDRFGKTHLDYDQAIAYLLGTSIPF